jgi:hypothetical protein
LLEQHPLPAAQQFFPCVAHCAIFVPQQDLPFLAAHCSFLPAQQSLAEALSLLPLLQQSMDLPWQQDIVEDALSLAWSFICAQQAHPDLPVVFPESTAVDGACCAGD